MVKWSVNPYLFLLRHEHGSKYGGDVDEVHLVLLLLFGHTAQVSGQFLQGHVVDPGQLSQQVLVPLQSSSLLLDGYNMDIP